MPTEFLADVRQTSAFALLGTGAVRAAAILLFGAVVSLAARRLSAATRHLIWTLTLGGALAVPAASMIVPQWRVPVAAPVLDRAAAWLPRGGIVAETRPSDAVAAIVPAGPAERPIASPAEPMAVEETAPRRAEGAAREWTEDSNGAGLPGPIDGNAILTGSSGPTRARTVQGWGTVSRLLIGIWAFGFVVAMLPTLIGAWRMARVARRGRPLVARGWLSLVPTALREIGVTRHVRFIQMDGAAMPMTWGILRPVVLLPDDAFAATREQRLDVLRHELAHVGRHDCLTQTIAQLACAVHWFNPLAWMAAREMRVERERACDDMVLRAGTKASDYADYLLRVAQSTRAPMAAAFGGMAMARPSQLGGRLRAVLDDGRRRNGVSGPIAARAAVVAIGVVAAVSSITPAAAVAREVAAPGGPAPDQRLAVRVADRGLSGGAPLPDESRGSAPAPGAAAVADAQRVDTVAPVSWPSMAVSSVAGSMLRLPGAASAITAREVVKVLTAPAPPCDRAADRSGKSSHSNSITSNNGSKRWRVIWSTGDCSYEIDARGDITYNRDVTDIATISRGGSFILEEHDGDDTRRLVIRPRDDGSLERSYSVNGARQEFDGAAQTWLAEALVALDRQTAFAVDQRVPAILARGGVDAVLQEITLLGSDYARRRYYTKLLGARELNQAQVRRVVEQAGRDMSSDYEIAELLVAVAKLPAFGDDSHQAFVATAGKIGSAYERRRALNALLSQDRLAPATVQALLEAASTIGSDYELAELLIDVAKRYAINETTRPIYLKAVGRIDSDYEHRRVLATIVSGGGLNAATTRALLEDARRIGSDFELAEFLVLVATKGTLDASTRDAYFAAADKIDSDYEHHRALSPLVKRGLLTKELAQSVLASAAKIDSDYECASLLVEVANAITIDDELRPAYERAADTIKGEYEYGRAMGAVRRRATR